MHPSKLCARTYLVTGQLAIILGSILAARGPGHKTGDCVEPLLDVRNLRTEFPTGDGIVHAVNGISYTVMPGEAVGLVGESGCGKSVSALSLISLVPRPGRITAGEVIFEGQDLQKLNEDQIRKI